MTTQDTAAPIEPMLVLSTAHVTQATCNTFLPAYDGPAWEKGDYGWFIYVVEDTSALPLDLVDCLALAREAGACWVMLDRDAAETPRLPVYDW